CRFRAIESRRAVARSVNMGVSGIIDGNGRVLCPERRKSSLVSDDAPIWEVVWDKELPRAEWGRFKKVPAVMIGAVPIDRRSSVYAHWGDWLPQGCWILLGLSLFWSWGATRRNTPTSVNGTPKATAESR